MAGISNTAPSMVISVARGLNIGGGNRGDAFGVSGQASTSLSQAISSNEYFSFWITPSSGSQVSITEVKLAANGQSNRTFSLMSSLNGFSTSNVIGAVTSNYWCCGATPVQSIPVSGHNNITSPVEFRIYLEYVAGSDNLYEGVHFGPTPGLDLAVLGAVTSLTDTQNPTAPGTLSLSGISNTSMVIRWPESTDDVALAGYNVYVGSSKINASPINALVYTLAGLSLGTSYPVSITAIDLSNKESAASTVTFTTNRVSVANISGLLTGSAPLSVTLSGASSSDPDAGDAISAYNWDFGNGSVATGSSSSYTFASAGIYPVSLQVQDSRGGVSTAVLVNITVTSGADLTAPTKPGTPSIVTATSNTLVIQWAASLDQNAITYYSVLNGTTTVSSAINRATFTGVNRSISNSIYIVAKDVAGNASLSSNILFIPANMAPVASISITSLVGFAPYIFTASGTNSTDADGSIALYAWSLAGVAYSGAAAPSFTLSSAGTYPIALRVSDDLGTQSTLVQVVVTVVSAPDTQAPTAPASLTVSAIKTTSAVVTWAASTDNVSVAGYNISVNGVKLNAGLISATSYTLTVLLQALSTVWPCKP